MKSWLLCDQVVPPLMQCLAIASAAAVAVLTLAGCANDSADEFNDADVTFAHDMIPHYQQAIRMAQLAQDRAADPEVKRLAADIEQAQDPEIQTMTDWLNAWGEDVPADMADMEEGDMSMAMPGMMSDQEMADMEGMSGAALDEMFLTMMIEHHQGAIEMAQTEQADPGGGLGATRQDRSP